MRRPFIKLYITGFAVCALLMNFPHFAAARGSKGKAAARQSENSRRAEELLKEALALSGVSDNRLALDRLAEAMQLWIQIREPEKAARAALLLGDAYRHMKRFRESLHCYTRALELPLSSQTKAIAFNSTARLYAEIYNLNLAKRYYKRAADQARIANDAATQAEALSGLAALHYRSGEQVRSLAYIRQARRLNRRQENETEANLLHLTGRIAQAQGLTDESRDALKAALSIYQQLGSGEQVHVLASISDLYLSSGQNEAALDTAREAVALVGTLAKQAMTKGDKRRVWEWRWRALLAQARAQRAMGQKKEAIRSYFHTVNYIEGVWLSVMIATDVGAVAFGEERYAPYHELVDALIEQGEIKEGYHVAEQSKSRAILSLIEGRRKAGVSKLSDLDEKLRELAWSIANLRTQLLSQQLNPGQREKIERDIEELIFVMEEAQAKADLDRPEERLAWVRPAGVDEVRERLKPDKECVLEFFLGEERSFLWFISSNDLSLEILPGKEEIEKAVEQYLAVVSARPNNLYLDRQLTAQRDMAEKLFAKLFGRVAERLTPGSRLMIVPDGILYYLPFESLSRARRYLVEDHEINYLPSASLLELLRGPKSRVETGDKLDLLAFGDPVFASKASRNRSDIEETERAMRASDGFRLTALPRTRDEVKEIAGLFAPGRARVFVGGDSTEEALKAESLRLYRRLHLASHSLLDDTHPSRSAVVLTLDADPREDGFLEVSEIAQLDLDCDLVVLSACQTGRGRLLLGEGIVGLSRAFLHAGARSLVVSLWNVSDISTGQLMKDFYQHLVNGSGNADALRKAKLQMIRSSKETRHPYYWAPFVVVGNP